MVESQEFPPYREVLGYGPFFLSLYKLRTQLEIENDLLWVVSSATGRRRLVVPTSMWARAFYTAHYVNGHKGTNQTVNTMRDRFYFPGIRKYALLYINNCRTCLDKWVTHRSDNRDKDATHTSQWSYFGQCLYLDTVGQLTDCTYQGHTYKHILTILDGFSRFLITVPLKNLLTPTVVQAFLKEYVFRYGVPNQIHSDNGTSFTSDVYRETLKHLGVYQTFCPPYNPQSNRVERAHLTLFHMIRTDKSFDDGAWVSKLPMATFLYNTIVNENTGYSPFEVVFGRAPTLPADLLWPMCPQRNDKTFLQAIEDLRQKWQHILIQIAKRQDDYHLALKANCNKYTGHIQVGDFVYYFRNQIPSHISKKLQGLYIGPFKVVRVVSDSVIVIFPEGDWATHPRKISVNVSRVRKLILSTISLRPNQRSKI